MAHIVCPHCTSTNRVPPERDMRAAKCGKCKASLFAAAPVTLSSANFEQHIQRNDVPVLVDFWASWCGPCQMMAPIFQRAASQLEPRLRFAKVNTETEQGLAARFGIRSIPTLVLFRGGKEVARQAGALDFDTLVRWVEQELIS